MAIGADRIAAPSGPLLALEDHAGVTVGSVRGPLDLPRAARVSAIVSEAARRTPTPFVLDLVAAWPVAPTALAVVQAVVRRLRADEQVEVLLALPTPVLVRARRGVGRGTSAFDSRAEAVAAARNGAV